ncbi:MAG: helix-turn-helix domain-containing protein [Kiritimatiellales bacterium]|nr:helix-turn-helix domain-containing protein [Kiritimatiellales bacterium]
MATLGQQLKAAREAKGASEHDAGLATKTLTKLIVAMEADDFSVMAAPMYAKGFIRLYADYLGLDPEPLIDEYLLRHAPGQKPLMDENSQLQKNSRPPVPFSFNLKWLPVNFHPGAWLGVPKRLISKVKIPPVKDIRILAGGIAAVLVLVVLIVSATNCARRRAAEKPAAPEPQIKAARKLLDEPLPDLYLVNPDKIESSR